MPSRVGPTSWAYRDKTPWVYGMMLADARVRFARRFAALTPDHRSTTPLTRDDRTPRRRGAYARSADTAPAPTLIFMSSDDEIQQGSPGRLPPAARCWTRFVPFIRTRDKSAIWARAHGASKLVYAICGVNFWLTILTVCVYLHWTYMRYQHGQMGSAIIWVFMSGFVLLIANIPTLVFGWIRALTRPRDQLARMVAWQSLLNSAVGPVALMVIDSKLHKLWAVPSMVIAVVATGFWLVTQDLEKSTP